MGWGNTSVAQFSCGGKALTTASSDPFNEQRYAIRQLQPLHNTRTDFRALEVIPCSVESSAGYLLIRSTCFLAREALRLVEQLFHQ
jgi:hypothetical protein